MNNRQKHVAKYLFVMFVLNVYFVSNVWLSLWLYDVIEAGMGDKYAIAYGFTHTILSVLGLFGLLATAPDWWNKK